ncbi:hypothetical protein M0R89_04660 [Halorussus limi]|uniref:Uncharacterized protein n=1 Tax=Halorussus limi TaxID=2938695 RepID=A0A8U0HWA3_9EURY|nr:hypothetical protein [Halorussus limi]UPV75360.1 hypothetical protein M0R89_04660 [Halorussus limi]
MDWDCKYCGETISRSDRDALKNAVKDHIDGDNDHRRQAALDFRRSHSGRTCGGQNCRRIIRGPDSVEGDPGFECPECGHDHCRWYVGFTFAFGKSNFGTD